jgi:hypothetical protein
MKRGGKILAVGAVVVGFMVLFPLWPKAKTREAVPAVSKKMPEAPALAPSKPEVSEVSTLAQTRVSASEALSETEEILQALMDEKRRGKNVSVDVVNLLGQIDGRFAEVFGLSKNEVARVQAAINASVVSLGKMELENATVVQRDQGKITVKIQAFPERGGQIYDALTKEIGEILGPKKGQAFNVLASESLDGGLGFFGMGDKTATLEWKPASKGYAMKEIVEIRVTSGGLTSVTKKSLSLLVRPVLLERMRPALAKLVDPENTPAPAK